MKTIKRKSFVGNTAGFSLMEVNMAVFVLAVGILSLIVLYPLGLRESTQGQADLKQSMFAEYLLNQAIGIASQPEITWAQWKTLVKEPKSGSTPQDFQDFIFNSKGLDVPNWSDAPSANQYKLIFSAVPGTGHKVMGIMVQSTDLVDFNNPDLWTNNPIYYAEVMFQGTAPDNGQL